MSMVSIVILSIIGIILLIGIVLFIIFELEMEKKVWVRKADTNHTYFSEEFTSWFATQMETNKTYVTSDSYDPVIDYLKTKGVVVYNSKIEFKKELVTLCEGFSCTTGDIRFYLISSKDVPELDKLGYRLDPSQ